MYTPLASILTTLVAFFPIGLSAGQTQIETAVINFRAEHIELLSAQRSKLVQVKLARTQAAAAAQTPKKETKKAPAQQPAQSNSQPSPESVAAPKVEVPATGVQNYTERVVQEVIRLTNIERANHGLSVLSEEVVLSSVARAHSADMLANDYFSHTNGAGCSSPCRVTNAGYAWGAVAENIHWMSGYTFTVEQAAQKIVTDWMNSPPHRKNILNSTYTRTGVGIVQSGSKIMSTALYALPR